MRAPVRQGNLGRSVMRRPERVPGKEKDMASMHDFEMKTITGETVSLSEYAGKVCLVVNVASE